MRLADVMSLSHREFNLWVAWLDEQWNKPSRIDHYLMQIAATVARSVSKKPKGIRLEHFKIPFKFLTQARAESKSDAAKVAKSAWLSRLGGAENVKQITKPKD